MWRDEFKPLPVELWLSELGNFLVFCADAETADDDRAVRRAFHLAKIAPLAVRRMICPAFSESDLEDFLERQGSLEAALRLVQSHAQIEVAIRRGDSGDVAAIRYDDEQPSEFAAPSPTRALLGAWAEFLTTAR